MKYLFCLFFLFSFSNHTEAVVFTRNFQPDTIVNQGDTITVITTIWNDDADTLKGLVYSEQVPFNTQVIYKSIAINNSVYFGITYEQGRKSSIVYNEMPYRWIFQLPPGFHEDGYLAPGDSAIIEYGLTCTMDTSFGFNQNAWYGGFSQGAFMIPAFGYDSLNSVQLSFTNPNDISNSGAGIRSSFYFLSQNYPNPFNPVTKIVFYLPRPEKVIIEMFDITGRKIKTLFDSFANTGQNSISFDGTTYSSGIYFYRMTTGNFTATKKMILIE